MSKHLPRYVRRLLGLIVGLVLLALPGIRPTQAQSAPPVVELTIGASTEGRPITAVRIGDGPRKLVLVGATHGYPERNTFELVTQLADHYRANPASVPPSLSLYIIPLLNPDGMALQTRFNANAVDLNRNMDTSADSCPENDWRQTVSGAYATISDTGGAYSESEVESRLIRDFLLDAEGVVFFHSNAGVVFPACGSEPSQQMARIFADGAGYAFIPVWDRYPITGGMHDWAGGLGIAAITPELVTGDLPEFEQNLGGVEAVLRAADGLLPAPAEHAESGVVVQPIIWRAWKAWGGAPLLGAPLGPAEPTATGWSQLFERARLTYEPALRDGPASVQIALLGRALVAPETGPAEQPAEGARFFAETGRNVRQPFADFWQTNGGLPIFGLPLTPEAPGVDSAGNPVIHQIFERAVMQRPADHAAPGGVTLAALGRIEWAQTDARSAASAVRAR